LRFTLRFEQFDGDVVEGAAGVGASDVSEAASGVTDLAVGHHDAGFGFALDGVRDVGRAEADVDVGHVVLMEKRGVVRGDAHAENADIIVLKDEMVMRLL
jgi:hypothetical protein